MTNTAADWLALPGGITGRVILPGSPGYEIVRAPAMARFANVRPAAVVPCATSADVAETITFARRFGLKTAARGGGHSVAGHSSTEGTQATSSASTSRFQITPLDTMPIVKFAGIEATELEPDLPVKALRTR